MTTNSTGTATSSQPHPFAAIQQAATQAGIALDSPALAAHLDASDPVQTYRADFHIPTYPQATSASANSSSQVVYLCGNSLGLQPKRTQELLTQELQVWAERGVMGHFDHPHNRPWVSIDETVTGELAKIVGASADEVACMGSLTNNLHLLMVAFYRPTPTRFKILIEAKAFPSDTYAVASQVKFHGFDPKDAVIALAPRDGEDTLRHEDIMRVIRDQGHEIALVMFSGVQYYTGQLFDMREITRAGQAAGCVVGWDLAHAVGNVPLHLHEWGVDFAAWCTYKYLNAGPGCIAGAFVHNKHRDTDLPRFAGWWGHDKQSRFKMPQTFQAMPGAAGFQLSNPSVVATVSLLGSLQVFAQTSMDALRSKSLRLTAYLEHLIDAVVVPRPSSHGVRLITPRDPFARGAQLSLLFTEFASVSGLMRELESRGVVVDEREPNVIRVSPAPLYNTFQDVRMFVDALCESLDVLAAAKKA
ncbi:kynureninase-like protein [Catenaria anguillulae PL171]|uniref:Kynureninase n=1 Tax=Catenaria anguillulae PL171 TaxID=765915 RepID=A0A1Y2HM67_9FUNG|nr:kynureninase-like protein [Catenaria anguillulae PL171]